jgi:2-dehydro-3-deoxyphosphogluconate aldolase/(4S)-4-hydroxy-2-oxoglutarate aldolase
LYLNWNHANQMISQAQNDASKASLLKPEMPFQSDVEPALSAPEMLSRSDIIDRLLNPGVIAVVRALRREQVIPLSKALVDGGITAIEITMSTPDAINAIREAREKIAHRAVIGVGTVLKLADCQQALAAGAQFIVTPVCRPEFVAPSHQAERPVMIGSYTPTEAQLAHEAGADFVKVFPADTLGPSYIKSIRAPLPHLKIVPTGGVDLNTIGDFFKAGCVAVGAGSALLSKEILQNDDWRALTKRASEFVAAAQVTRPPNTVTR